MFMSMVMIGLKIHYNYDIRSFKVYPGNQTSDFLDTRSVAPALLRARKDVTVTHVNDFSKATF